MTLDELRRIIDDGEFHHATYRDIGRLFEGLVIYVKHDGPVGFKPVWRFGKDSPDLDGAEEMVKHTGISVGSFGRG